MSTDETDSKDRFFQQLAQISEAMSAAHGQEFAMGSLILAARFIAEREAKAKAQGAGAVTPDSSAAAA